MRCYFLVLLVVLSTSAQAQDYCLALRGNGELAPAHWGAMANLAEKMGLPVAQAGGSSATVTMMLNDAIASSKYIANRSGGVNTQRAALMYKSLEGLLEYLTNKPISEWRDFRLVYQRVQTAGNSEWLDSLESLLSQASGFDSDQLSEFLRQNVGLIQSAYLTGVQTGVISMVNYAPLMESLERLIRGELNNGTADIARAQFYARELKATIGVFGAFNADSDDNLFFRPGIIDFDRFAEQMGRVATFYSGLAASTAESNLWQEFFIDCAERSAGLTWSELISNRRECSLRFKKILDAHFNLGGTYNFSEHKAGLSIKSYPTTSVLVGSANREAREALVKYGQEQKSDFGSGFYLSHPEDVKFGFWGDEEDLLAIKANLPKTGDEKSSRFLPLGQATWRKVLSLSPAEPGLASMQPFLTGKEEMVSVGGWSDLHPVRVLKAAGCERVIYVTRRGPESPFAQGVAKRLFAVRGKPEVAEGLLHMLYDLKNPVSSMRQSLDLADAVLCTDWSRFNVTTGLKDLIRDSYRGSPYYVRNQAAFSGNQLAPQLNPRDIQPDGTRTYEGCY